MRPKINPRPRFYLIMITMVLAVFVTGYFVAADRLAQTRYAYAAKAAERNALNAEIADLQQEIDYAQTDEYIERAARDMLGMVMPGEIRYMGN